MIPGNIAIFLGAALAVCGAALARVSYLLAMRKRGLRHADFEERLNRDQIDRLKTENAELKAKYGLPDTPTAPASSEIQNKL